MSSERQIIPRTVIVGSGTMVSRLLGLVREMVTAPLLGAGAGLDLFLIAFKIPNLFRRIFGEGAMRDAFLPVFGKELADPNGDARRLFNIVMTALATLLGAITLLGWIGCWVAYRHPRISEHGALFCLLLAIMLPYLPLICLTALQSSVLNQKGRFLIPSLVPTLLNVCWIAGVLLYGKKYGTTALAFSVLVAGVLQFVVQIPLLWRLRLHVFPAWDLAHKGLRRTLDFYRQNLERYL